MNEPRKENRPLIEQLKQTPLPRGPGVYLFKDERDRVIYVGKAKNLYKRVHSYFKPDTELSVKTALMMERARGLDTILTATEKEAFILESNLIKQYLPRYNIILRDDKRYPCLRLNIRDPFPNLTIVRKIKKDGALYFGPFSSANAVRSTHRVIDRVFKLRKCRTHRLKQRSRPCLNFQMNRCLAPCACDVSPEAYEAIVKQVRLFLEGRNQELLKTLGRDMQQAAERLDFEKAAAVRDQIRAIEKTVERQHVVSPKLVDQDVIGVSQENGRFQVVILYVRKGYLMGTRSYLLKDRNASPSDILEAFVKQYYARGIFMPRQVLLSHFVEDQPAISDWLSGLAGKKVLIRWPQRGEKKRLINMAVKNAENLLQRLPAGSETDLMARLGEILGLPHRLRVIEGLDISNLKGEMAVGSVVSFVEGEPHRAGYKNYGIAGVNGIDDYGMMGELVARRMTRGDLPDVFLVDGGKGHLNAVKKAIWQTVDKAGRETGPPISSHGEILVPEVLSIAKPERHLGETADKIYIPGRKNPLVLKPDDPLLHLMMRIRDEAHRRAIGHHRQLRKRGLTQSDLDKIPGIGTKRKQRLLQHFHGLRGVSQASVEALQEVPGISRTLAESIANFFK
ncbi:MAG: excinuclease ABC subunit UvrC [Deltaproteobacteria bacterium]|nr:excinuclease ABC subunit UvrC [Deltaproteobacteria bacterium]